MLRNIFWPRDKVSPNIQAKADELHRLADQMRQEAAYRQDDTGYDACDEQHFFCKHWKDGR